MHFHFTLQACQWPKCQGQFGRAEYHVSPHIGYTVCDRCYHNLGCPTDEKKPLKPRKPNDKTQPRCAAVKRRERKNCRVIKGQGTGAKLDPWSRRDAAQKIFAATSKADKVRFIDHYCERYSKCYNSVMSWTKQVKKLQKECDNMVRDGEVYTKGRRRRAFHGQGSHRCLKALSDAFSKALVHSIVSQRKRIEAPSAFKAFNNLVVEVYLGGPKDCAFKMFNYVVFVFN